MNILRTAILLTLAITLPLQAQDKAAEKITYDDHARPLLVQRCGTCHDGQRREGGLDITNYINLMQGGGSGAVIEPQDASASYLYNLITHEDSPEMPPSGTKIPDPEIELIANWINQGALENKGSKAAKKKPKLDMELSADPAARPEVIPMPLRMPLEPVIQPDVPSVLAMATSPWAPIVALSTPKQILLYNTQTFELEGVLPVEEGVAHSLRFTRNGKFLIAGGGKDGALGKAILYNALTGERVASVGDELETVLAADISSNLEYVAIGGPNKLVKLFYTDGTLIATIEKHTEWVTALEFSPDGKYLASGDRNGGLHVWDAATGSPMFTLNGHSAQISSISWRADSKLVASASEDSTVKIWEVVEEGKQIKSWTANGGGVTAMEFRRDGNLVTAGRDKTVKLWDQDGKVLKQFTGLPDVAVAVASCDETDRVLAADWTGQVRAWNVADGAHLADLDANPPSLATRLEQDQQQLVAAQQKYEPLAATVATTKTAMDQLNQQIAVGKEKAAGLDAQLKQQQAELATAKSQFDASNQKVQQWTAERDASQKLKPLVAATLQAGQQALTLAPEDGELKQTVQILGQKVAAIDARLNELNGAITKESESLAAYKATMDQLTQASAASKTALDAAVAEVAQYEAQLAKMGEQMQQQQAAAEAANQEVVQISSQIEKWKSNLSFVEQLNELKTNIQQVDETVATQQAAVDAAHQELIAAQKKVDAAKQAKAEAEQQRVNLEKQLEELRSGT